MWFARVTDVQTSDDGRIYVGDSGQNKVFIYSPEGAFREEVGRQGSGPGEFLHVSAIHVIDSVLVVSDIRTWRTTRFTLDGELLESYSMPALPRIGFGTVRTLRHGYVLSEIYPVMTLQESMHSPFFHLILTDSSMGADTLARVATDNALWFDSADGRPYSSTATPFGNGGAWAQLGDSALVVADGYTGEVTWYLIATNGVEVARRTRLDVTSRQVTDADLAEVERDLRTELGTQVPRRIEIRGPSRWSGITRIVPDQIGEVLYVGFLEQNQLMWRTLHADDSLTPLELPKDFDLKSARGATFYGVVCDSLDIPTVVGLRLLPN